MKYFEKVVGPPKIPKFPQNSKIPNFPKLQKTPKFRGNSDHLKKTPNFQFSVGFSLNFVELIRYTPHPNLYA